MQTKNSLNLLQQLLMQPLQKRLFIFSIKAPPSSVEQLYFEIANIDTFKWFSHIISHQVFHLQTSSNKDSGKLFLETFFYF